MLSVGVLSVVYCSLGVVGMCVSLMIAVWCVSSVCWLLFVASCSFGCVLRVVVWFVVAYCMFLVSAVCRSLSRVA